MKLEGQRHFNKGVMESIKLHHGASAAHVYYLGLVLWHLDTISRGSYSEYCQMALKARSWTHAWLGGDND